MNNKELLKSQKEWRKKWAKALRSGEYKQTTGALYRTGDHELVKDGYYTEGHCCLGVLCDISGKGTWEKAVNSISGTTQNEYLGQAFYLPKEIADLVGLTNIYGHFSVKNLSIKIPDWDSGAIGLSILNDMEGIDFNFIANVIEEEPKGLFNE